MECEFIRKGEITCSIIDRNQKCFECDILIINNELGEFQKSKDKLWDFVDYNLDSKPIQITSKRKFERICKEKGKVIYYNKRDPLSFKESFDRTKRDDDKREIRKVAEEAYRYARGKR